MLVTIFKFWEVFFMGDTPNATDITKALALLGGGPKKDGGGGMIKGLENILKQVSSMVLK